MKKISNQFVVNTVEDGESAQYIYLKGTAKSSVGSETTLEQCVVSITGGNNVSQVARGLNLVTINRQTLSVTSSVNYDTHAQASGESGASGITNLINKLNSLSSDVFVCLVSYDAIGWNDTLIEKLQSFGMSDLPYTSAWRYPFLFIGYSGLGKGNGITRMLDASTPSIPVELSVYIANGALSAKDGERGKIGRFFYFGGVWEEIESADSFVLNDAQAPYFEHTDNGQKRYHVYNPNTNPSGGTITKAIMAQTSFNNEPWEAMTNDFKYIITQALFAAYAQLGSWIFNSNYMLSEKDANGNPRGQQVYNGMGDSQLTRGFIPSIAFDALNGRASFGGDKVRFQPNGAGWLANKNIQWDANGNATFNGVVNASGGTFNGTVTSENVAMMNKILMDGQNGKFALYGPSSVDDDDQFSPAEGAYPIELFSINFKTDADSMHRYAQIEIKEGEAPYNQSLLTIEPQRLDIRNSNGDDSYLTNYQLGFINGNGSRIVEITYDGVRLSTNGGSVYKSWEQIFNNQ